MKNEKEKTYDKKIYAILGIIFVSVALMLAQACNRELESPAAKEGAKKLDHATSIYEVEFDGAKYIVIDTY